MSQNQSVLYVDFGYRSAAEWWVDGGLAAYKRFVSDPTRQSTMEASVEAWHIHEWVWHETNPGADTRYNADFAAFQSTLLKDCPELAWIRDVADAAKHRGLGRRSAEVQSVHRGLSILATAGGAIMGTPSGVPIALRGGPLEIELTDGTRHHMSTVLETVVKFWNARFSLPES